MLLAVDIGNTNVTIGLFRGTELLATWRLATDVSRTADEYAQQLLAMLAHRNFAPGHINHVAMCSSVPPLVSTFSDLSRRYLEVQPLVVGSGVRSGIKILYDDPRQVGPDRVVDAVAAWQLYGGPVIVVDFGTATVFDAVSADGNYLGGAIAPGLGISTEALFQRASLLSRIELTAPARAIGRNTMHSMQSGIVFGYVGLIEGLIRRFHEELGTRAQVVATGGFAPVIASQTPMVDVINPDLTLIGLRQIWELNRKPEGTRPRKAEETA